MRVILDSNEYILGLETAGGASASSRLLDLVCVLIDELEEFRLLIPEIIVREVQRNLPRGLEQAGTQTGINKRGQKTLPAFIIGYPYPVCMRDACV
jgi:hypothetical protein